MFEGAADALAFTGRVTYDMETGNIKDLRQIKAEASQKTKAILSKIEAGYNLLQQLTDDPQTRAILENFAAEYYKNMSGLMILNDVSSFVGGLIPAIIVAVLTKNPEALGLAAASLGGDLTTLFEKIATLIQKIIELTKKIRMCRKIDAAKLDKEHVIAVPPKSIDAGAQYHDDLENLPYPGNDPTELQHPTGSEYNLPGKENMNFSGEPLPKILPPGAKIYRVIGENNVRNGAYWLEKLPNSLSE